MSNRNPGFDSLGRTLYQLWRGRKAVKRHPTIANNVLIQAGASFFFA